MFERTSRRGAVRGGTELPASARRELAAAAEVGMVARSLAAGRLGELCVGFAPGAAHPIDALRPGGQAARLPGAERGRRRSRVHPEDLARLEAAAPATAVAGDRDHDRPSLSATTPGTVTPAGNSGPSQRACRPSQRGRHHGSGVQQRVVHVPDQLFDGRPEMTAQPERPLHTPGPTEAQGPLILSGLLGRTATETVQANQASGRPPARARPDRRVFAACAEVVLLLRATSH